MAFNSLTTAILVVLMVLPGHVALRVANCVSPRYVSSQIDSLLLSLAYGVVIVAVYFKLFPDQLPTVNKDGTLSLDVLVLLDAGAKLIIASAILGFLIGWVRRWKAVEQLYDFFHLNAVGSPSSWDFMFENIPHDQSRWMMVHLKGEKGVIYGRYGSHSHATMAAHGVKELFLEEACKGGDGSERFIAQDYTRGVYISGDDISSISLYYAE